MPWLCDNTYAQSRGQSLADVLAKQGIDPGHRPGGRDRPRQFVHVVNPWAAAAGSLAAQTQALTFETLHQALYFAGVHTRRAPDAGPERDLAVGGDAAGTTRRFEVVAAALAGDQAFAQQYFRRVVALPRSILDLRLFQVARTLPLVFDLVDAGLATVPAADYLIYTNVDICVTPGFYLAIDGLIDLGFDGLLINRRTIDTLGLDPALAPLMAGDLGRRHEGYDCLVFSRRAAVRFRRTTACIGSGGVMRSLLYNMVAHCERLLILTDAHFTWHVGDDKAWRRPELQDYIDHNWDAATGLLRELAVGHRDRLRDFCTNNRERLRVNDDGSVELRARAGTA